MLTRPILKFGPFEVDSSLRELRKDGARVPLQDKPLRLLTALAERPGAVVTRAELQQQVWEGEAFVDFDRGLNTAVNKLRIALGDDAESPRYIETIPKQGYRFVAPVEVVTGSATTPTVQPPSPERATVEMGPAKPATIAAERAVSQRGAGEPQSRTRHMVRSFALLTAAVLLCVGVAVAWLSYSKPVLSFAPRDSVLIADFENRTGDPRFDKALETAFAVSLGQSEHANIFPRARLAPILAQIGKAPGTQITPALGREICQRENIRGLIGLSIARSGDIYSLSGELIDPQSGAIVRSHTENSTGDGHILDALDTIAGEIRRDLGESLYQIHENRHPLPQVTTSSLPALKDYADGVSLWRDGQYHEAVAQYHAALQADPNFAMAHAALGSAYYSYIYNKADEGDAEFKKALALVSRTTEREWMRMQVEYTDSQGHSEEAERLYQVYLKRYPDDWTMLWNYAHLLRTNDHVEQAIGQYQQMLHVDSNDAVTEVELATAYKMLGRFPEAIAAYTRTFQIDPHYLTAGSVNREYGMTLIQNGEAPKAEQVFSALLGNEKTRENGWRSLALLDLYQGKYASARPLLDQAVAYDEGIDAPIGSMRVRLLMAILAEGEGDKNTERRQLNAAMKHFKDISPKVIVGAWIGSEYARAGMVQQAQQIETSVAPLVDGKNAEQHAYWLYLQGEIALARGNKQKAIDLLSLADKEKSTPFSAEALARAYQEAGNLNQAVIQYEKLFAPGDGVVLIEPQQRVLAARYTLAADDLALGKPPKAKEALQPLLVLWKDADKNLPLRKQVEALSERLQ